MHVVNWITTFGLSENNLFRLFYVSWMFIRDGKQRARACRAGPKYLRAEVKLGMRAGLFHLYLSSLNSQGKEGKYHSGIFFRTVVHFSIVYIFCTLYIFGPAYGPLILSYFTDFNYDEHNYNTHSGKSQIDTSLPSFVSLT